MTTDRDPVQLGFDESRLDDLGHARDALETFYDRLEYASRDRRDGETIGDPDPDLADIHKAVMAAAGTIAEHQDGLGLRIRLPKMTPEQWDAAVSEATAAGHHVVAVPVHADGTIGDGIVLNNPDNFDQAGNTTKPSDDDIESTTRCYQAAVRAVETQFILDHAAGGSRYPRIWAELGSVPDDPAHSVVAILAGMCVSMLTALNDGDRDAAQLAWQMKWVDT